MVAAECRHSANTGVTIGLMRRRRLRSAIRRVNDYGVVVDSAEFSRAERRTDCSRWLDPAAIGRTAVALEVAEELNLILEPTVRSSTRTSYEPLRLAQTGPRVHDVPAPRNMNPLTYCCDCEGRRPDNRSMRPGREDLLRGSRNRAEAATSASLGLCPGRSPHCY
jgi:hypothetical protein